MTGKAEIVKGQSTSSTRSVLAQHVPLATPYIVQIFPAYACNFRCNYCIHSVNPQARGFVAGKPLMNFSLYEKCIQDLTAFPQPVKMLRFAATGEPLVHPRIADMIRLAVQQKIAQSIEIVTNGSLLTHELSDALIDAGLNWLRVSIQGLSAEKYKTVTGVDVDYEQLIENLRYFYRKRNQTKMYIKIIDACLDQGEEQKFYDLFGSFCDRIAIEHLLPAVNEIDYSRLSDHVFTLTQNGRMARKDVKVCPQPFYMMQINPDGNVVPCCSMETPCTLGDCRSESLLDIWRGRSFREFQLMQLKGEKHCNAVCAKCQAYKFSMFDEDILDPYVGEIMKKFPSDL